MSGIDLGCGNNSIIMNNTGPTLLSLHIEFSEGRVLEKNPSKQINSIIAGNANNYEEN